MTSGIYRITCVPTGDFYIGSTSNFKRRKASHWSEMRKGIKKGLWGTLLTKYSVEDFLFEILLLTDNLIDEENKFIKDYSPTLNISPEATFRPYQYGENNPASKHTNLDIYNLMLYILKHPWIPLSTIDTRLCFSRGTAQKLVKGNRYKHLSNLYPTEYNLLVSGEYQKLIVINSNGIAIEVKGNINSIAKQLGISDVSAGKLVNRLSSKVCGYSLA